MKSATDLAPPGPPVNQPPQQPAGNPLAITAMVLGIVAICTAWVPFVGFVGGVILGGLALVFGIIGVVQSSKRAGKGKGQAIAGIVTGVVAFGIFVVSTVATVAVIDEVSRELDSMQMPDGTIPQESDPDSSSADPGPAASTPASTCDAARESFLTGSPAEIKAALQALVGDTTADGTAREYAQYYMGRDAGDPQMQEMDKGLIQAACSLGSL